MAAVPTKELLPGSGQEYDDVLAKWIKDGRPDTIESMKDGWMRRAVFPDGGQQPTFLLVTSTKGSTDDADGPQSLAGYGLTMATRQSSFGARRRALPQEPV